ncbi:MAG TPA: endolytic transglycosylase MltG, partial [Patescibacteria group bacterium]|nr:endolytic transglycosylase MltG [Patescibacteria group bacterium]
ERHGVVPADQFLKAAADFDASQYPILESKPKTAGLEGFIFPDTYFVSGDPSTTPAELSEGIVEKALNNFSKKFTGDMQAQARRGNMSVYQIVTLASIIERETGRNAVTDEQKQALDEERRIIAGIFYNRLNIGMPLESDATVNFITKKNTPQATASDTAIDSPYNTYKYKGLPPGPISNPSLSSIMAALYPTKSDYYYFLHKQPSGEPVYSKTYEEHLRNKAKYLDH